MSSKINTQGDLNRFTKDSVKTTQTALNQIKHRQEQIQRELNNKEKALFKKTVSDSYVKIFGENYGDNLDYYSLINSLIFTYKQNKDGTIAPSFTVNLSNIQFRSDAKEEHQKFNENSYDDFISNEEEINGDYLDVYDFDSPEEYEEYMQSDEYYNELLELDSSFIPTERDNRYGMYNKINKLAGYTSPEESNEIAMKLAKDIWDKMIKNRR